MTTRTIEDEMADRAYWHRVGAILGDELVGWTYRKAADFARHKDVPGTIADKLLSMQAEIDRLKKND